MILVYDRLDGGIYILFSDIPSENFTKFISQVFIALNHDSLRTRN